MKNSLTIGIDEVGRGPLAGPLVVAAVALDNSQPHAAFNDSKKLTSRRREELVPQIQAVALGIGIGWVDAPLLDKLGMTESLKLAARRAYMQLPKSVKEDAARIVIDGNIKMLDDERVVTIIKADAKVAAVEAASIAAKQARDHYMYELAKLFPQYQFEHHVGYGTEAHMRALAEYGALKGIHRYSFRPVAQLCGVVERKVNKVDQTRGRQAETCAANYLVRAGYEIIERNWKTPEVEVDIIARKGHELNFVEVKYRETAEHGDGVAAITRKKLEQMTLGCEMYQKYYPAAIGFDAKLSMIALSGDPIQVDQFINNLSLDLL